MKVGRGHNDIIYCDVDGTLLFWKGNAGSPTREQKDFLQRWYVTPLGSRGVSRADPLAPTINLNLVSQLMEWLESTPDASLVVWSATSRRHAEAAVAFTGITNLRAIALAKPDLIIDDDHEKFKRKTPGLLPHEKLR